MIEIKRSSGSNSTQSNVPAAPTTTTSLSASAKVLPAPVTSSAVVVATSVPQILQARANEKPEDVTHLKTEVQELKQRIASITKNVDELTCLVKNISVSDNEVDHNNKRKKTEPVKLEQVVMEDLPMPDWNPSSSDVLGGVDDASGLPFPSLLSAPLPEMVTSRETSISSNVSDEGFVDDLFQAFVDEDVSMGISALDEVEVGSASNSSSPSTENTPDPKLMKRIEDSLATLPKDIHEMVANRFIQAIVITEPIAKPVSHPPHTGSAAENIASVPKETRRSSAIVDTEVSQPPVPIAHCNSSSSLTSAVEVPTGPTIPLPLAIATLRTILAEHGVSVECHRAKDAAMSRRMNNTIPVVPVHA